MTRETGATMSGTRQLIGSGGPLEAKIGYSRAVRVGDVVAVAGTAAIKDGVPFAPDDAAAQTRHILEVIERALTEAGASMRDVVRYRVYVTDIADAPAVGAELSRVFMRSACCARSLAPPRWSIRRCGSRSRWTRLRGAAPRQGQSMRRRYLPTRRAHSGSPRTP